MSEVTIYHNPRCSKSRQTLELLRERGVEPEIVHYLETPPEPETLADILQRLGAEPREIMRHKEAPYKENGLDDPSVDREALLRAIKEHPVLLERPIVVANGKAAIGRPPENVLEIL